MEQRLANSWRMTVNEKQFIETALLSEVRVDGRRLFDYRKLSIKFGREDGSAEVQLGQTHVMGFVTAQLVQPYRDRPNEGSLSIFTEFSPMADPSFEPGRPGESAVELGRIIDRGLRESRAVDTESLCVLAGKLVWSIRIDLHILDNCGNLVDASNIAALAALLTFRRLECTVGGEDGQEVVVHPPEVREPLALIVHHLPIAVTFAFFGDDNIVVIDPTHNEEAVMGGRMTVTLNANGDVCAIQKAGGAGVRQGVIMQCLRIASVKAGDITSKIKSAVESYNTERALRKIKRHPSSGKIGENTNTVVEKREVTQSTTLQSETQSPELGGTTMRECSAEHFSGGPSSWVPDSKPIDSEPLKSSPAFCGKLKPSSVVMESRSKETPSEANPHAPPAEINTSSPQLDASDVGQQINGEKTLSVKHKNKRKKKKLSVSDAS